MPFALPKGIGSMPLPDVQRAESTAPAEDSLYRVIASTLNITADELTEESSPDTVPSWDSLNHLNIVMAIEGEFEIALSADEAMEMRNVGLIRAIVRRHGVEL
jgi:acyl carrier protein